ncbi:TPA: hypothetical protein ACGTUJ_000346 [Escherichia coli]
MKPTYEQLEQQLAAVVSENAGLKSVLEEIINADEPEYHEQGMGCGVEDRGYQRDGYSACYYGWESAMERVYSEVIPDALPETPVTDAHLAEMRAQGVDQFKEYMRTTGYPWEGDWNGIGRMTDKFAAQLRQGAEHE